MRSCASFSEATYSMSRSWNSRSSAWRIRWSHGVSRSRSKSCVCDLPFVWRVVLGVEARELGEIVNALISCQRVLRVSGSDRDRQQQHGNGEATHGGPPSCEAAFPEWRVRSPRYNRRGRSVNMSNRVMSTEGGAANWSCAFSAHGRCCARSMDSPEISRTVDWLASQGRSIVSSTARQRDAVARGMDTLQLRHAPVAQLDRAPAF